MRPWATLYLIPLNNYIDFSDFTDLAQEEISETPWMFPSPPTRHKY